MTVIRVTLTTPTSTRDSTTVTFSVYATDSADASDQFKSITGDIPVQSAFTAPGFTNAVVTASSASSSASPVGVGGVGGGSVPTSVSSSSGDSAGAASAAVKSQSSIGVLLAGCGLGLGVGLLAMWL